MTTASIEFENIKRNINTSNWVALGYNSKVACDKAQKISRVAVKFLSES